MRIALKAVSVVAALLVIFSARGYSSQRRGFAVETAGGYQVSNVKYWTGDGGLVESVDFDLDAPAHDVTALVQTDGDWLTCVRGRLVLSWSCPVGEAIVHMNDADTFQVRAH